MLNKQINIQDCEHNLLGEVITNSFEVFGRFKFCSWLYLYWMHWKQNFMIKCISQNILPTKDIFFSIAFLTYWQESFYGNKTLSLPVFLLFLSCISLFPGPSFCGAVLVQTNLFCGQTFTRPVQGHSCLLKLPHKLTHCQKTKPSPESFSLL